MIGMDPIADTIERFGILDHVPHEYAITLGAGATTPLRLTAAYAMIVNGGKRITPTVIDRVQDRNGKTIWRADDRPCDGCTDVEWQHQPVPVIPDNREQVADPGSAYQLVTMMQGVVSAAPASRSRPSASRSPARPARPTNFRDAWFEGFNPDLAAGVYVGYDEPDSLGKDETGGHVAAPIFRDFMIDALKNTPAVDFRIPPGLRLYRVSAATGLPVSGNEPAIYEAYKPGTEPGKSSRPPTQASTSDEGASPDSSPSDSSASDSPTSDSATSDSGPSDSAVSNPATNDAQMSDSASGNADAGQTGSAAPPPAVNDLAGSQGAPPAAAPRAMLPPRGAPASGTGGLY